MFVPHQCNYVLRGNKFLETRIVKSVRWCTESISFLAQKIWEILPNEIKDSVTLQIFKVETKKKMGSRKMPLWTMQNISTSSRLYLGSRNTIYIYKYIYIYVIYMLYIYMRIYIYIYVYVYIIKVKLTSISFPISV